LGKATRSNPVSRKRLAYVGIHGSEDPTRAIFPFLQAAHAVETDMDAEISRIDNAVVLMHEIFRNAVFPVGWPPVQGLFAGVVKRKVPIVVRRGCAVVRRLIDADPEGTNADFDTPLGLVQRVAVVVNTVTI
jgi:hypothetical protein